MKFLLNDLDGGNGPLSKPHAWDTQMLLPCPVIPRLGKAGSFFFSKVGVSGGVKTDRGLASAVAKHKAMFFAEKAADQSPIGNEAAIDGNLMLTPVGEGRAALEEDYSRMVGDGLLLDDAETFDELIERCAAICSKANAAA